MVAVYFSFVAMELNKVFTKKAFLCVMLWDKRGSAFIMVYVLMLNVNIILV